uniref:Uncharacterized protein n=1 Tax=Rhizophora mucronata TaxID=61149 RepID=A0A2P2Q2R8_RHIMU
MNMSQIKAYKIISLVITSKLDS